MASITREKSRSGPNKGKPNNCKVIHVVCADGKRRSIRLGKVDMRTAEKIKTQIEHLNAAKCSGSPMPTGSANWLASIDSTLHKRIANAGLCEPREAKPAEHQYQRLGPLLDHYLATEASDLKSSTRNSLDLTRQNLIDHFGEDRNITTITKAEAREWRRELAAKGNRRVKKGETKPMADNTVRRRTERARQFFNFAIEQEIIESNPFVQPIKMPAATIRNEERMAFVTEAAVEQCLAAMHEVFLPDGATGGPHPNAIDFRTMIALARYGGLRCPSELVRLKWEHVDFGVVDLDEPTEMLSWGWMTVHAIKTERYEGRLIRRVPIFADLQWYLREAQRFASKGSKYVIQNPVYRQERANNRTSFEKAIKKVGVTPWEKLFQNLRASCETAWHAKYPLGDVAPWLGHSVETAAKHYIQSQHKNSVEPVESYVPPKAHEPRLNVVRQAVQQPGADGCKEVKDGREMRGIVIRTNDLPFSQLPDPNSLRTSLDLGASINR